MGVVYQVIYKIDIPANRPDLLCMEVNIDHAEIPPLPYNIFTACHVDPFRRPLSPASV